MAGEIVTTKVRKITPEFSAARRARIDEALSFKAGSQSAPARQVVAVLPNGKKAVFLKPGKEAARAKPNIHDMGPWVGTDAKNEFAAHTFEDIWTYLVEVSIINQLLFKQVLTLLYRLCYFIDHAPNAGGGLRYAPGGELLR